MRRSSQETLKALAIFTSKLKDNLSMLGGRYKRSLPEGATHEYHDIKSKDMVKLVYQTCGWDTQYTYRIKGIVVPERSTAYLASIYI